MISTSERARRSLNTVLTSRTSNCQKYKRMANNIRLVQYPEQLKTCKLRRYGYSYLMKLPNSKRFIVIGPHWPGIVTTTAIILGATIMNIKYIKENAKLTLFTSFILYSIIVVGFISTNLFLWLTALSDPGIMFKGDLPADNEHIESAQQNLLPQQPRRFYCEECNMQEPRGVYMDHCHACGYCIQDMDHHCPWMGQCIGKKNMK